MDSCVHVWMDAWVDAWVRCNSNYTFAKIAHSLSIGRAPPAPERARVWEAHRDTRRFPACRSKRCSRTGTSNQRWSEDARFVYIIIIVSLDQPTGLIPAVTSLKGWLNVSQRLPLFARCLCWRCSSWMCHFNKVRVFFLLFFSEGISA